MPAIEEMTMTLKEVAKALPMCDGKKTTYNQLWRWCLKGVRCGEKRVHLKHLRRGKVIVTNTAAVWQFWEITADEQRAYLASREDLKSAGIEVSPLRRPRTAKQRAIAQARAMRKLEEAGIVRGGEG